MRGLKRVNFLAMNWQEHVAPYVGAWIETYIRQEGYVFVGRSHPTWVRGLKLASNTKNQNHQKSHPTWVRGLKLSKGSLPELPYVSHPTWVRGLKLYMII